jgi:hypothetical protein
MAEAMAQPNHNDEGHDWRSCPAHEPHGQHVWTDHLAHGVREQLYCPGVTA